MKKKTLLWLIVQIGLITTTFAQVSVVSTVGSGGPYTTLKGAFDAINLGTHTGTIDILITASTTETATAALNASGSGLASYTSISIKPSGGAWTIGGNLALPLVDLNGADNVYIDGLNTGGNALTISNSSTGTAAGTSTIRFMNDATGDTLINCSILGSAVGTSATTVVGNIIFNTTTGTTGNDNNAVIYCNIGPAGSNLPAKAIFSAGTTTSAAHHNSGISVTNCNIYDYFYAAGAGAAIYISTANAGWNISHNKFYQTAQRTQTTGGFHAAVYISGTGGNGGHSITNNTIGYATSAGTGTYKIIGTTSTVVCGVYIGTTATGSTSSIQGNTITNIEVSGAISGTTSTSPFIGLNITSSIASIGNITPNTIGNLTSNDAIKVMSSSTSTCEASGIYLGSGSCNASNNNIGGITISNSSTGATIVVGIRTATGTSLTHTIANNTIGGTVPNSMQSLSSANATQAMGISVNGAGSLITGNTIKNLTAAGGTGSAFSASISGIMVNSNSANHSISNNTIYALTNISASAATIVNGIYFISSTGTNTINGNFIHSLNNTSTAGILQGICITGGTLTCSNNMIRLGIDTVAANITNGLTIYGINESGTSAIGNFYHNSIYTGGANVTGTANTYAFYSTVVTNARNYINNIFSNMRSNSTGTGKHYAVKVGGTTVNAVGLGMQNNLFYASGTGSVFGSYNGVDIANLSHWQYNVGGNEASGFGDPQFLLATGTAATVDLHINAASITPIEGMGVAIAGLTADYDNTTRNATTPDVGADEGSFLPIDAIAPVISYTKLFNHDATLLRSVNNFVAATDNSNINTTVGTRPRLYFKKQADNNTYTGNTSIDNGWKYVEATNTVAPFSFTIDYSILTGGTAAVTDVIQYFVVAQDLATAPNVGINAGAFTTTPSSVSLSAANFPLIGTANSFKIVNARLNGILTVGSGQVYTTLGAVAADLSLRGIDGPVILRLMDASYTAATETFPITFSMVDGSNTTNTITLQPTLTNTLISGSNGNTIIDLNGVTFMTIDGRINSSVLTKDLIIENTSTTATSSIRLMNDAYKNTIQYCTVKGVATGGSSGTVLFGTTNGNIGNDTNTIDNCDIKNGVSRPLQGVYGLGSTGSATTYNDNNVVSNCNIFNYFNATTASSGIKIDAGNAGWQIINNSFYDTAAITYTTAATHHAIFVNAVSTSTTNGSGFKITNNFIGGNAPGALGTLNLTSTGTATISIMTAIELFAGMGTPSLIQNNTITNITMTSSTSGSTALMGINMERGVAVISDNIIGSTSTPSALNFTATTNGGGIYGIRMGTTASGMGAVTISNNTLCGIEVKGSTTSIVSQFTGIASSGGTTIQITGNTVGSPSMINAINASTVVVGTVAQAVRAIITNGTGAYTITGNLIANMNSNTATIGATVNHIVGGILFVPSANSNANTISNNTIHDLSNASQTIGGTNNSALLGIAVGTGTSGVMTVTNNRIYNMKLTGAATLASVSIRGIYFGGTGTGNMIAGNRMHNFSVSAANTAAVVTAIETGGGTSSYYNNMIQLGIDTLGVDQNTGYIMNGVNDAAGTNSFYYNSIYIGGQSVTNGASNTYAFNSSGTGTRNFINNSFYNARSNNGGTGKHYAVKVAGTGVTPSGLTMNNNLIFTSGTGGVFGYYSAADVADLTAWITAVGLNTGSISANPIYALPNGTATTVDLAPVVGSPLLSSGIPVAGITTDLIGVTRSLTTPSIGAGETTMSLPVELLSFSGSKQKRGVQLRWVTASEINNDYFVLQRSTNGQRFESIAKVKGHGNTQQASVYSYLDETRSLTTSKVYYRLIQVDYDSKQYTSQVVVVTMEKETTTSLQISPNPFKEKLDIQMSTAVSTTGTIRVLDIQGKTVLEKNISLEEGINHIHMDELSGSAYQGMYFVYIITPSETFVQKVIKGN